MNQGTAFLAPFKTATPGSGFFAGLDPPILGSEWHEKHWFELKRGPRPLFEPLATTSISANRACPSRKNALSSAVSPVSGTPAPGGPPRGPGSTGVDLVCPQAWRQVSKVRLEILPSMVIASPHDPGVSIFVTPTYQYCLFRRLAHGLGASFFKHHHDVRLRAQSFESARHGRRISLIRILRQLRSLDDNPGPWHGQTSGQGRT